MRLRLPNFKKIGTGSLYRPGSIPGTRCCLSSSRPQGYSAAGRAISMKNSSDVIGYRTRDLRACSAVPQPNTLPLMLQLFKGRALTWGYCGPCECNVAVILHAGHSLLKNRHRFVSFRSSGYVPCEKRLIDEYSFFKYNFELCNEGYVQSYLNASYSLDCQ